MSAGTSGSLGDSLDCQVVRLAGSGSVDNPGGVREVQQYDLSLGPSPRRLYVQRNALSSDFRYTFAPLYKMPLAQQDQPVCWRSSQGKSWRLSGKTVILSPE